MSTAARLTGQPFKVAVNQMHHRLNQPIALQVGDVEHIPTDLKLLFLALRQAAKKWTMPIHHWREALNHFTILWPERMPALERVAS